ncbi:MAG: toxin-antitoxin system YwqK family antitoxin, partial [Porticoccaceae bacterium]
KNGEKDGFAQGNYPTGEIGTTSYYEDGQLHGLFTLLYKNGQIKRKVNYTDGYEDGLQTTFDTEGRAAKQCFRAGEELDMSNS